MTCKKHKNYEEFCAYCECERRNLRNLAGQCVNTAFEMLYITRRDEVTLDDVSKLSVQLALAIEKEILNGTKPKD
jgi:hypothetical protein